MPQESGRSSGCNRSKVIRGFRLREVGRTLLALLIFALVLVEVEPIQAQLFFTRQPRARQLLQNGRDAFARGDYEKAAQLYQQAQASVNELSPTEQSDLKNQIQQNNLALQERKAGAAQLKQAEEALQKGQPEEAAQLLKRLDTNQYLASADRKTLTRLTEQLRKVGPAPTDPPASKKDYRTLLNEARAALQRGELDLAEQLTDQADKANTGIVPNWLQPWNDTPTRVRRDIQAARQKAAEKSQEPTAEAPKSEGTSFPGVGVFLGISSRQPAKDTPPPTTTNKKEENPHQVASATKPPKKEPEPTSTTSDNKPTFRPAGSGLQENAARARQLLAEANLALQKGDTIRARQLMEQAEALQLELSQAQDAAPNLRPAGNPPQSPLLEGGIGGVTRSTIDPGVRPAGGVNPPAPPSGLPSEPIPAPSAEPTPPTPIPPVMPLPGSPRSPLAETPTEQARRLVKEGYSALQAGDYARAKQLAEQARSLKPELKFWEDNPEKLLKDIERVAPVAVAPTKPGQPAGTDATGLAKPAQPVDPRALLRQARELLEQGQLEEAERLVNRAAAMPNPGWRLFEDSPAKVRADLQKRRHQREREEAQKLLAEARKLFIQGQLKEAKELAWKARTKYGSPTIWDLGDRPDRLINEIEMVEMAQKLNQKPGTPVVKDTTTPPVPPKVDHQMPPPPPSVGDPVAQVTPPSGVKPPPLPTPGQDPRGTLARQKALALVAEARALQREGKLIEARHKALEAQQAAMDAQKLGAVFAPTDDIPELLLFNLASMTGQRIGILLKRMEETAARTSDPTRFDKARADLEQARQLASAYGLDQGLINDKTAWLQQLETGTAQGGPVLPGLPKLPTVDPPPPPGTVADLYAVGKRLLEDARRELRRGQLGPARTMVQEAFDPKYGVQKEAEDLLRTLDVEEAEQRKLAANRNADAVRDAYLRKQFHQAATIASTIDIKLLTPDRLSRLKEIMSMPEMQPQALALTEPQKVGPGVGKNIDPPGVASVGDPKPGPLAQGPTTPGAQQPQGFGDRIKALEDVQFDKLRTESMKVQNEARKFFQAGEHDRALELLREYTNRLAEASLDPAKIELLRRPVEKRLQDYRTLKAEADLAADAKIAQTGGFRREQIRLMQQQKKQEQVSELMKEYRELYQQGKYKEAKMVALKAKDIDPENVAVDAALQMSAFQERIVTNREIKSAKEDRFLRDLDFHPGPYVDAQNPMAFNRGNLERLRKRGAMPDGISFSRLDAREREIEHKLHYQNVHLNFKDVPLGQALEDLQGITGINIIPDERALELAGISLKQNLSLRVENVSLRSALELLLKKAGLTYIIKNQVIEITTLDNAKGRLVQRTYPVADLIIPVQDHSVSPVHDLTRTIERWQETNQGIARPVMPLLDRFGLQGGEAVSTLGSGAGKSGFGTAPGSTNGQPVVTKSLVKQTIEDQLIKLITTVVAPDSWAEVGGKGTIQYYPLGLGLVVNQTLDVQEQVADLLRALRKLQDLEVAIEVRLIAVSETFFERIGLDFDVNITMAKSRFTPQLLAQNFQPFGFPNAFIPDRFVSGLTPAGTFTPDLNVPLRFSSFDFSVPPFGGYPGTLGADGGLTLGLAFLSDIQVFMLLEAAQGDRRMNIMQAPRVTVFNGQSASILVNQNQFFLTAIQPLFLGDLLSFLPQQQPFPVNGILINITPVVTADRRFVRINFPGLTMTNLASTNVPLIPIQVPVPQRFFDGIQTTNPPVVFQMFFQQPAFETITVTTTVTVPDGGTVLLGGMKTLSEARNEFGPPILSKIPYINRLVKNVGYGREASSLMIMVTPRIIINEEEEQIFLGELEPIPR